MKRNFFIFLVSTTFTFFLSTNTFAQIAESKSTAKDISIKVYCAFNKFVFGSNNEKCFTKTYTLNSKDQMSLKASLTTFIDLSERVEKKQTLPKKIVNISQSSSKPQIVYVQGPAGKDGKNGTTTIVYQTSQPQSVLHEAPAAYVNPGLNNVRPYQTTIPGDIWETFIHFLRFENAIGNNLLTKNLLASTTDTANLNSESLTANFAKISDSVVENATLTNATTTNFVSTNSTSTNLSSVNANLNNATSTNLFTNVLNSISATLSDLFFNNATGTNIQLANLNTSNLNATGTATLTNAQILSGNATLTNATITNLVVNKSNISNATSSTFFSNVLNSIDSTFTTLVSGNATNTNATSTNFFTSDFKALNTYVNNLITDNATSTNFIATFARVVGLNFTNGTGTNATTTNFASTNINSTNLFSTNLSTTNFSVANLSVNNATITNSTSTNIYVSSISSPSVTGRGTTQTIGTVSNNVVSFIQNNTEVMKLKTTGDVSVLNDLAVGRDTGSYLLHVGSSTVASGAIASFVNRDGNCSINPLLSILCVSDMRLKKNIEDVKFTAMSQLKKVSVKEYNMISQEDGTQKQVGFIAQNLETIFPWLVQTNNEGYKTVSYSNMTPVLVKAFQEISEVFYSKEIHADKLCVGETCFTESEVKDFKTYLDSKKAETQTQISQITNTSGAIIINNTATDTIPITEMATTTTSVEMQNSTTSEATTTQTFINQGTESVTAEVLP